MLKRCYALLLILAIGAVCASCAGNAKGAPVPDATPRGTQLRAEGLNWPEEQLQKDETGVPLLHVYITDESAVQSMDIETYVEGVLAGEMKNDWPMEALKAQAILARTFVLKFIQDKESKYPDADISTDIEEAQAYSAADVNDRIRQAVSETRGMVMAYGNELPYAWFHAHSGGATDLASVGLGWNETEPGYTQCIRSAEPETISDEANAQSLRDAQKWVADFPLEALESALAKTGNPITLKESSTIEIGERGDSGRAVTLIIDGKSVNAAALRIALGSTRMRSTLLNTLSLRDGMVRMSGRGYGHGVGMSQWGAYGMAQNGSMAEEIVKHYFRDVTIETLW